MKFFSFAIFTFAAFMWLTEEGLAHKVNVFAYIDGDEIQVECSFSRSQKVKNGRLVITDLKNGDTILEGVTDDVGLFRFRPTDEFLATGHGLNIRLFAGEGHEDNWRVSAEDLRALSSTARLEGTAPIRPENFPVQLQPGEKTVVGEVPPVATVDAVQLEAIVSRILDAKLSPINRALASKERDGPGLGDVIGGIGWIIGLLGLATYMKYRR